MPIWMSRCLGSSFPSELTILLCNCSWQDMNNCLFTTDRALNTDQSDCFTQVSFSELVSLLALLKEG